MAISEHNIITSGLHGRVGNLIFRRWGERTVVSAAPGRVDRKWSKLQTENRERFRDAMVWAKVVMKDPEKKEIYLKKAKGMQTAWNVVVSEYMNRLAIAEVDTSLYKGRKGNLIRVKVHDDYRIRAIILTILSSQGMLIESGKATPMSESKKWVYTVSQDNPDPERCRIVVKVSGSAGTFSQTYRTVQRK
jgi:hypothetical protein